MNLIDLREKKNKNNTNTPAGGTNHPNDANSDANTRIHPNDANKEKREEIASSPADWRTPRNDGKEKPAPLLRPSDDSLKASNASLPIVWEADEFEYHHKDGTWFLSAGIIGLAFLAFAAMTRNFLMIPLIFIFAFVIYVFALKKPRLMEFEISGDGVAIKPAEGDGEGKFFPFKSLTSFWIFERGGGWNELSFETDKLLYPYLKIPLAEDIDVKRLREVLGGFVEEKEQEESLSEILARWLKF